MQSGGTLSKDGGRQLQQERWRFLPKGLNELFVKIVSVNTRSSFWEYWKKRITPCGLCPVGRQKQLW